MFENKEGIVGFFNKLCELSFTNESKKEINIYRRPRYTEKHSRILKRCVYETLFEYLNGPWVGEKKRVKLESVVCQYPAEGLSVVDKISVAAFKLRQLRRFDEAQRLEDNVRKWKSLCKKLEEGFSGKASIVSNQETVLRLLVALSHTGPVSLQPLIGCCDHDWADSYKKNSKALLLPEGPLLITDSSNMRQASLDSGCYVHYPRELFENVSVLAIPGNGESKKVSTGLEIFEALPASLGSFFDLQESSENNFERNTRMSLFSALVHSHTDDLQVNLALPELPSSPSSRSLVLSAKETKSLESQEDEGFHELPCSVASSSSSSLPTAAEEDIWTLAAKLPPQKFYTWEMNGRRHQAPEKPYLTEAGPAVFDELYNILMKQVSYLVKEPRPAQQMVTLSQLVKDSLNVLLGVPSVSFDLDKPTQSFIVRSNVRTSGCSPEIIQSFLSKLAAIGTDYIRVNKFANHHNPAGGHVLQAFRGALQNLLHCYRAVVLSVDVDNIQSPFQLYNFFRDMGKQLRFLAEVCICSEAFKRSSSDQKPRFPTGVKLLSYLYELCLEHSSSEFYSVLLSLLKNSVAPYILFIQNWVFKGVCHDLYGEFMIEVDDQYLAYRDKHYWTNGFLMADTDKLKCVPMFLEELADDIFVCGKSINLLRLCCPEHYLCDPGIPVPRMEVTFSLKELQNISLRCQEYTAEVDDLARKEERKRLEKQRAQDEAKQNELLEEKQKAEKALREIEELIRKAKEAVQKKKREDFEMLKEQMERALKDRVLAKEREDEEDANFVKQYTEREVTTAAVEDELKEKTRQDLIKYYEELKREVQRREQRALWIIERHRLDEVRSQFLAEEELKLQQMKDEIAKPRIISNIKPLETRADSFTGKSDEKAFFPSTPLAAPNPGIISLIASGVKTDALVRLQSDKERPESQLSFVDSGVDVQSTIESTSEGLLRGSQKSLTKVDASANDGDDTDASVVLNFEPTLVANRATGEEEDTLRQKALNKSNIIGLQVTNEADKQRKKWESAKEEGLTLAEQESKERRTWESPPEGGVTFAETPFPHGHPSESSIQHVLYSSDKHSKDEPVGYQSSKGTSSDSTAQDLIYGSTPVETGRLSFKSPHGHPSDSAAQEMIYGYSVSGEIPKQTVVQGGHATDSTAKGIIYGAVLDSKESKNQSEAHPSDDSLGEVIYPKRELIYTPDSNMALAMAHRSRSYWGHPSESSVEKLLGDISTLGKSQQTTRGTPPPSTVQHLLYSQQEEFQYQSSRGSQMPSTVQNILYPSQGDDFQFISSRGTPPPSTAQDLLYPTEGPGVEPVRSTRGHEPAVRIKKMLYPGVKIEEQKKECKFKPLELEDVWVASRVEPLMDNFDILDQKPISNLLERVLMSSTQDAVDDEIDGAQLLSLPVLLQRSVTAPLLAQISLVNSAIVNYFVNDLGLQKQFDLFRKILFMEDGEFALSLSEQLFEKVSLGLTPRELCTPTVLNNMISRALQMSVYADTAEHAQQLSFALKWIPDMFKINDLEMFDFLELRNRVHWPMNIVVTENSIIKYNKVFTFMLRIKRVSWVLREIWFHLKHIGHSRKAAGSPQLRQLQLFRHELQHFVDNIQGYLSNQILNVSWAEFQNALEQNIRNLDDLHRRHTEYLNKAIFRSLLNKKASPVMKIICDIFSLALKLHTQLMSAPWQQHRDGGQVIHPAYGAMCSTMKTFKDCSGFLFTVVSKLVKRGYQSHLEDFLLRINFNDYYKTSR